MSKWLNKLFGLVMSLYLYLKMAECAVSTKNVPIFVCPNGGKDFIEL
jgi:hypothetical protein